MLIIVSLMIALKWLKSQSYGNFWIKKILCIPLVKYIDIKVQFKSTYYALYHSLDKRKIPYLLYEFYTSLFREKNCVINSEAKYYMEKILLKVKYCWRKYFEIGAKKYDN